MKRALLALAILVLPLLHGQGWPVTFVEKNFAQLVTEADEIFVGTVSSLESRKLPNGAIVTDVRFSDLRMVKGDNTSAAIVLLVLGGEVGSERLEIPGLPQFQLGARYLVFAQGNGRDMFPVVGGHAGIFRIILGSPQGSSIVSNAAGMPLGSQIAAEVRGSLTPSAQGAVQAAVQSPLTQELFISAIKARLGQR